MGQCLGLSTPENAEINDRLGKEEAKDADLTRLLLLGTGNTGKTTFHLQFKLCHGHEVTIPEKTQCRREIEKQVILYMGKLALLALHLYDHGDEELGLSDAVQTAALEMKDLAETESDDLSLTPNITEHVATLWEDDGIKRLFRDNGPIQRSLSPSKWSTVAFPESCEYFWDSIERISMLDYRPTRGDMVQLRSPTTGVQKSFFRVGQKGFEIIDVGGQRAERKKWLHVFDNIHTVLYVISLTAYDEVLYEDGRVNAMDEQLRVWEDMVTNPIFYGITFVLFFNKTDLLQKKIDDKKYITSFVEDYPGEHTYDAYCEFIENLFLERMPANKEYHLHRTCATDANKVQFVVDDVTRIFVKEALDITGL